MNDLELQMATNPCNVTILQIGGVDRSDYPDFVDVFVIEAYNDELDRNLSDLELDYFDANHYEITQEHARQQAVQE